MLTSIVENGFTAVAGDIARLDDRIDGLATKDDFRAIVRKEIAEFVPNCRSRNQTMRQQLGEIEKQLDAFAETYKNLKGHQRDRRGPHSRTPDRGASRHTEKKTAA
jgi:hypothetical protein